MRLESVDLAFIRMYLYLFGDEGKLKLFAEIKRKKIPIAKVEFEIQDYIIRALITSNLELWNPFSFQNQTLSFILLQLKNLYQMLQQAYLYSTKVLAMKIYNYIAIMQVFQWMRILIFQSMKYAYQINKPKNFN